MVYVFYLFLHQTPKWNSNFVGGRDPGIVCSGCFLIDFLFMVDWWASSTILEIFFPQFCPKFVFLIFARSFGALSLYRTVARSTMQALGFCRCRAPVFFIFFNQTSSVQFLFGLVLLIGLALWFQVINGFPLSIRKSGSYFSFFFSLLLDSFSPFRIYHIIYRYLWHYFWSLSGFFFLCLVVFCPYSYALLFCRNTSLSCRLSQSKLKNWSVSILIGLMVLLCDGAWLGMERSLSMFSPLERFLLLLGRLAYQGSKLVGTDWNC